MKSSTASGLVLMIFLVGGCGTITPTSSDTEIVAVTSTASPTSDSSLFLSQYAFPSSIDPKAEHVLHLGGAIASCISLSINGPQLAVWTHSGVPKFACSL